MHDPEQFLQSLAIVLGVAAVTTWLFQRLRQPVVLGYVLAGLITGPNVPVPLVADARMVHTLSELGVILLMFGIGLEFSLGRLRRMGAVVAMVALLQVAIMIWLGYAVGRLVGWPGTTSLFLGAAIAISSTIIIGKAFEERPVDRALRDLVFGVLIAEDLIAIVLLAVLSTVAAGGSPSAREVAVEVARLAAFLAGTLVAGLLVVPRFVRAVVRLGRAETILVASVGLCFVGALLAHSFGYSVALGAFLAGTLVAESGQASVIEPLVQPVRDLFAAIFFVAVGMALVPAMIVRHVGVILVVTAVVIVGKLIGVGLGAFLGGYGVRTSVRAGMSLAQIGELSFIIAGLALSAGAQRELYTVAVAVSALTTLATPWLIRASDPVAAWVDRRLPRRLQTFASLYGAWVDRIRASAPAARSRRTRLLRLLALDAACLVGTIVATSLWIDDVTEHVVALTHLAAPMARLAMLAAATVLAVPLALGILRLSGSLGAQLARDALPDAGRGRTDLALAPRRSLVLALQLGCVLVVGAIIVAITQPFVPLFYGVAILVPVLLVVGIVFWRSAAGLQGHVRAGAEVIAEALSLAPDPARPDAHGAELAALLEGLGTPVAVRLADGSPAVGHSLRALNVRGLTGATVLAILRGKERIVAPSAQEVLRGGDVLGVTGSHEAIEAARALLTRRPA